MRDKTAPAVEADSMDHEYHGDINTDTSEDKAFWKKESAPRFTMLPPAGQSRWTLCYFLSLSAVLLLILVIAVSVSNVKVGTRFSAVEKSVANLTEGMLSIISRLKETETRGHDVARKISNLELDVHIVEERLDDLSKSLVNQEELDRLKVSLSQLKCSFIKVLKNNTKEPCCPLGWSSYSAHCYLFSEDGLPWNAARDECERQQASLLVLESKEEKRFVTSRTMPLFYWLGLTDERTGEWEWLDGTPYTINSEWMPGQPDDWHGHGLDERGEDCAHFHRNGKYNDDHCTRTYRYVCKASATATFI